jgi:D-alanine--poly(phosphoribitol) ligase subunit 1
VCARVTSMRLLAHDRFEVNVAKNPGQVAVRAGERSYTYERLNAEANRVADYLRQRGVSRGDIVGICLPPSADLVIGILAILKLGAAYAPLDAAYPEERLQLMTSQVKALRWVLTSRQTESLVRGPGVNPLDIASIIAGHHRRDRTDVSAAVEPDDLCYVVFTSGTTGIPKATGVKHRGWWNLLSWFEREYGLGPHSSNLLVSAFGFDISQRSIMSPLFSGATLHLMPSASFDAFMAKELIARRQVRTLHCAPSTLYLLLEAAEDQDDDALGPLDYVFIGGEVLTASRLIEWARKPGRRCKLVHQYGVAECTDVASSHVMKEFSRYLETGVPIGKPVDNCHIAVLDSDRSPVKANDIGEIYISGAGVGAGYLNNDALTAERFVRFEDDRIHYRTGDLGRVYPNGDVVCIGRIDNQVKIRGIRLDLGDVEAALRANKHVQDAVVVATKDHSSEAETILVAFIIRRQQPRAIGAIDERRLRAELLSELPKHMIPHRVLQVQAFPTTRNGKIDRKELERRASLPPASRDLAEARSA